MKQTSEQLHERGPPLTQTQRRNLTKEAHLLTHVGLFAMVATAVDFYFSPQLTQSNVITHAVGEAGGMFIIAGIAEQYRLAAQAENAVFSEMKERIKNNCKAFATFAAIAMSVASSAGTIETLRHASDEAIESGSAKTLPAMACDTVLYKDTPTTPRHFSDGRRHFVFQGHYVDCSSPAPQGFKPLPAPPTI